MYITPSTDFVKFFLLFFLLFLSLPQFRLAGEARLFLFWLCTKHRLIFTHRHRFTSSAQRFDKDRLRLFIKASLPARGVTISGDDRRFACTFAAPTAATSVSAAGPRAGSTRGRVLFYFFQSLFSTQPLFFKLCA